MNKEKHPELAVRAVISTKTHILVCHVTGDKSFYFLPGGRVEPGESLAQGLFRELREELPELFSVCVELDSYYLGAIEALFKDQHSLQHFFRVLVPDLTHEKIPSDHKFDGISFEWLLLDGLENKSLKPPSLAPLLLGDERSAWYRLDDER